MQQDASEGAAIVAHGLHEKNAYFAGLLRRIAKHDASAFEALYRASARSLFGLALRVTRTTESAEEVVQDGFIKIWRFAGTYDPTLASPSTWMSAIVKNQALDYLRRNAYSGFYVEDIDEHIAPVEADDDFSQQFSVDAERLSFYLGRLTPVQRQAIALAYFRGQSQSEIAYALDAPIGTVKSWISRGLDSLRSMIDSRPAPHPGGSC
ncbi:RNA polymerase sigma factor [Paraburkholderia metrosideri]|jgi:RNA polymerase sigma-70 factor (ECF subfamily)|uniref:ECF RNA polymerase sigma factor SigK n=1 Tax=Paraburkholderia metrosideri TaxID=580937 RepID=A0ABN7HMX8_9BURK|nr:sigma-70 family RNA polymerase sigma factor [Paraburkholderia metrosideri]CAD6528042.1 ECF RNA polymerase sigma factor SigK [Paraburkholderia metrosideri]